MEQLPLLVGLAVLRERGAARAVIEYSGSGDSGGIDESYAEAENGTRIAWPEGLQEAFEEWAWKRAIPHHGWENNEGGHGTVMLDLATREAEVEHHDRYETDEGDNVNKSIPVLLLPVVQALERLRAEEVSQLEFMAWAAGEGERYELDEYSLQEDLNALSDEQAQAVIKWLGEVVADGPTGGAGGSCDGRVDLDAEPMTAVVRFRSKAYGETTDVNTVEFTT